MTDELQELEPIEETQTAQTAAPETAAMPAGPARPMAAPGLPAPAYNPTADKEYYRFLLAGVVMFIGCMMPYGAEPDLVGYRTLSGAFYTVIAIGMIWSWWGAIASGRFSGKNLKWVGLAILPLILLGVHMMKAFSDPGLAAWAAATGNTELVPEGWGDFFAKFVNVRDPAAQASADVFVRWLGAGKIVTFLGALFAEFAMLLAVFGGAKAAKAQKAARAAAPAKGRRR